MLCRLITVFGVLLLSGAGQVSLAAEMTPIYRMDSDPDLSSASGKTLFDARNIALWVECLGRPDSEFQRLAANAIAEAHRRGHAGLDATIPDLRRALARDGANSAAQFAIAEALIVLEARECAGELFQTAAAGGLSLKLKIEPALAKWKFEPGRDLWLSRLKDAHGSRRELLLAMEGLAESGVEEAVASLRDLVTDKARSSDIRLAAARAAGSLTEAGLEPVVAQLISSERASKLDRLCAAAVLDRHTSQEAQDLLATLAGDAEPSVASAALDALFRIRPELVLPLAEQAMSNADPNVRWQGQRCYLALPTPDRIRDLGKGLDDVHPRNRSDIRDGLAGLASQPDLDSPVRETAMAALARDGWREQEQSALLLAALRHVAAAPRLVELLEQDRAEVMIASAWALKELAVPETLPAMLEKARRQHESPHGGAPAEQSAHLFEALSLMDYQPAAALMRMYVPKGSGNSLTRCAAIWGLGHLFAGKPDEDLAMKLMERAQDTMTLPPEEGSVRKFSAISLGRMKAESQVSGLESLLAPEGYAYDPAVGWALHEITGRGVPVAPVHDSYDGGWFLEPTEPPRDAR